MDQRTDLDFADFVAVQTRPLLGLAHALTATRTTRQPVDLAGIVD